MPPRPRTMRPRSAPSRRPRVAGLAPGRPRPSSDADEPLTEVMAVAEPAEPAEPAEHAEPGEQAGRATSRPSGKLPAGDGRAADPAKDDDAGTVTDDADAGADVDADAGSDPDEDRDVRDRPVAAVPAVARLRVVLRRRAVPLLAVAAVVLTGLAVLAGVQDARLRNTPAATNVALVDVGATAEAANQLSDAVETVYSFDHTRLDENESAAREVITPAFAAQFDRLFAEVRARAPEQQAVVSATVTMSAVKELSADRAVLVAFVDQQATRAAPDAESQQLAAAGRLTVTGEWVDGRWKIAAVTPL